MISYFESHKADAMKGLQILPGVKELLTVLKV